MHITKQLFFLATLFATISFYTVSINAAEDAGANNIVILKEYLRKNYSNKYGKIYLSFLLISLEASEKKDQDTITISHLQQQAIHIYDIPVTLSRNSHDELQATQFTGNSLCNINLNGDTQDIINLLSSINNK